MSFAVLTECDFGFVRGKLADYMGSAFELMELTGGLLQ